MLIQMSKWFNNKKFGSVVYQILTTNGIKNLQVSWEILHVQAYTTRLQYYTIYHNIRHAYVPVGVIIHASAKTKKNN